MARFAKFFLSPYKIRIRVLSSELLREFRNGMSSFLSWKDEQASTTKFEGHEDPFTTLFLTNFVT